MKCSREQKVGRMDVGLIGEPLELDRLTRTWDEGVTGIWKIE